MLVIPLECSVVSLNHASLKSKGKNVILDWLIPFELKRPVDLGRSQLVNCERREVLSDRAIKAPVF